MVFSRFEEISNNAWPALQSIQYDGWLLRFANGVTKRSNSVSMLYPSHLDPSEKVRFCESLYQSRNITPCFKITSFTQPSGMDPLLGSSGYFVHSYISFQTLKISDIANRPSPDLTIETRLRNGWIDDFIRMNEFDPRRKNTYLAIMNQIFSPMALVSVKYHEKITGVGLGVVEGPYIGLFDIVVDPAHREQGLGRRIVEAILSWGKKQGAHTAYLQVLTDNFPAINLYKKMGFNEKYQYWYRMKKE
ncbi:MAG: GNAT family N-acetyltransferase [Bacteroidales bacterium]|nr:GNAT family N-acetyltransferase [Bacteroidales bacterium]